VTFGTSEIIEITSDQSDEYFAHIKQEINKLNEQKPKKSILKGSKINKDSISNQTYTNSEEEKIELD
jgi:proline dehydrogenase